MQDNTLVKRTMWAQLIFNTALFLLVAAMCLLIGGLVLNNPPLGQAPGTWPRLKHYLTQNVAETRRNHEFPELELRCYRLSPAQLYARLEHSLELLDWQISERNLQQYTLHAVITSRLFQFQDDLYIELRPASCGTELYIRSQSRVGKGDLAANTRHILTLQEVLARQV